MSKFEYWSLNIEDWCISLLLSALVFTYILCYDFFWILLSLIKPEGKKLYRVSHQFGPNLNWGFFSTGPPQPLEHIPWISIGSFSPLILQRKKCPWVPVQAPPQLHGPWRGRRWARTGSGHTLVTRRACTLRPSHWRRRASVFAGGPRARATC